MPVVEEYWAGVVQRLQAEVDVFARLVRHHGEKGRENEAALSRLLESFVPARIGVGTGMIIDRHDNYSRQTDIVLFEQSDEPAALAQTTQLLFPVEGVLGSIEVKTTLRRADLDDCFRKKRDLLALDSAVPHLDGITRHPLFVLLAYSTDLEPVKAYEHIESAPAEERPDLLCILDAGLVGGIGPLVRGVAEREFAMGQALLRSMVDGRRTGDPVEVPRAARTQMTYLVEGRAYPVVGRSPNVYLGEPARALLLFVEALARSIARLQDRPQPIMSHYLDDHTAALKWLAA